MSYKIIVNLNTVQQFSSSAKVLNWIWKKTELKEGVVAKEQNSCPTFLLSSVLRDASTKQNFPIPL